MNMASTTSITLSPSISALQARHTTPRRRLTTSYADKHHVHSLCQPLSSSIEALDLSPSSPTPVQVLATIRLQVLSYLADLETRLVQLESPIPPETLKSKRECSIEDARMWAQTGLEMLARIRSDVLSHIPDLHLEAVPSVEEFVKAHMPDTPTLDDVCARLPAMPEVLRSRLPDFTISDMRARLEDVRSSFNDIDFSKPLDYIPTLSESLRRLQMHLLSSELPQSLADSYAMLTPSATLSELLDRVLSSQSVTGMSSDREGEDILERAALEVARAIRRSLDGSRLIHYVDLPERWRNNHFVTGGYRFIPLRQWPLILMSLFALHNETVNIHTHLIPFLAWSFNIIPVSPFSSSVTSAEAAGLPELTFTAFALACLFCSALWHTMSGCAHPTGMEICARVDYVGIGWLISASVGTIVYYGFEDHLQARNNFLMLCGLMGVLGSVFPFMRWFNDRECKGWRIVFFLALAFTSIAPLAYLGYLFSVPTTLAFIAPVLPSLIAYIAGLVFYATHFPECVLSKPGQPHWLNWLGGGSHAIWHVCIVIAISLHRRAMDHMKLGIGAMQHP